MTNKLRDLIQQAWDQDPEKPPSMKVNAEKVCYVSKHKGETRAYSPAVARRVLKLPIYQGHHDAWGVM